MAAPPSTTDSSASLPYLFQSLEIGGPEEAGAPSTEEPAATGPLNAVTSSDGEFELSSDGKAFPVFSRSGSIQARDVTFPAKGGNIKGGTLMKIVHDVVQKHYLNCRTDVGSGSANPIKRKGKRMEISHGSDWTQSLGMWRRMGTDTEVVDYTGTEIVSIRGKEFEIKRGRLKFKERFTIGSREVTQTWRSKKKGHVKKLDLAYTQIKNAIEDIKKKFKLSDPMIAKLQLGLLKGLDSPREVREKCRDHCDEIVTLLHFLNGLMFGIEASGINSSLATSLMTLDLISEGKLTFSKAFKVNTHGGNYPFSTFAQRGVSNKGTYVERANLMQSEDGSTKKYRANPKLTPVGIKQAMMIRRWIKENRRFIHTTTSRAELIERIKTAVSELLGFYFPNQNEPKPTVLEKFREDETRNESSLGEPNSPGTGEAPHAPAGSDSGEKANSSGKNDKQRKTIGGAAASKGKKRSKAGAGPEEPKKVARKKKTKKASKADVKAPATTARKSIKDKKKAENSSS